MIAFGPVPSRRLGQSLGINNVPRKTCSYSCVYCQIGETEKREIDPRAFYTPDEIFRDVETHAANARAMGEVVDYLTFVPDGEPTLDRNLGNSIQQLRRMGIPVAVISNASLIHRTEVRNALSKADWASLKIDTLNEDVWHAINRPHPQLKLEWMLAGIHSFAGEYRGTLATETMLVKGMNDDEAGLRNLADFIREIKPHTAFIAVPTRPPSVEGVQNPDAEGLARAFATFREKEIPVEGLLEPETGSMAFTGNLEEDVLGIASVHPLREDEMQTLLDKSKSDWSVVQELITEGKLKEILYLGTKFYLRTGG